MMELFALLLFSALYDLAYCFYAVEKYGKRALWPGLPLALVCAALFIYSAALVFRGYSIY